MKASANSSVPRRNILALLAGSAAASPRIIPTRALGREGAVAPSERIVLGEIGLGPRGQYDLGAILPQKDVQFVAMVCTLDIETDLEHRIIARQLRSSLLHYMSGRNFQPKNRPSYGSLELLQTR